MSRGELCEDVKKLSSHIRELWEPTGHSGVQESTYNSIFYVILFLYKEFCLYYCVLFPNTIASYRTLMFGVFLASDAFTYSHFFQYAPHVLVHCRTHPWSSWEWTIVSIGKWCRWGLWDTIGYQRSFRSIRPALEMKIGEMRYVRMSVKLYYCVLFPNTIAFYRTLVFGVFLASGAFTYSQTNWNTSYQTCTHSPASWNWVWL